MFISRMNSLFKILVKIMLKCDLHGYRFKEAKFKIIESLRKCFNQRKYSIHIIHGYHGHILKDYIESQEFLEDMKKEGFPLQMMKLSAAKRINLGESFFKINLKYSHHKQKRTNAHKKTKSITKILQKRKKINMIELQALLL